MIYSRQLNKIDTCPSCGAKIDLNESNICKYCDSKIVDKSNDFVIVEKRKM